MGRTGIFGGVFDPVHRGHLAVARHAREAADLDRVHFVPTDAPPHKAGTRASIDHRKAMVLLAIDGEPGFLFSDAEIGRGPAYTWETVRRFAEASPGDELFFVCGFDSILQMPRWRRFEEILARATLLVAPRPGYSERIGDVLPAILARSRILHAMEPVDLSATGVAGRLAAGDATAYDDLPPRVAEYVREHGLYMKTLES